MPRPYLGPKLWLDPRRGTWTILDGRQRIRTGMFEGEHGLAQQALEQHCNGAGLTKPERPKGPVPEYLKNDIKGVYVAGYGPYIKIGVSVNINHRIAALQMPEVVTLYGVLDGWFKEERALHKRFAEYRLRGEWFLKKDALADWINGGCK